MLKIRPQTKCSPRKNGIKKFPEFWPSRAGTERTEGQNHKVELDALSQNMLKIRPQTNVPPGKMELKNSRSSGRAGLEPSELKSKLKVELDALSQNMLKIRPQTKCSPRKNGIKKFPEFWPSRAGTERVKMFPPE